MKELLQEEVSLEHSAPKAQSRTKVCMHVLTKARNDVRVFREAETLVEAGFDVSIVDIESDPKRPDEEFLHGILFKHLSVSDEFMTTRFTRWTLFRSVWMLISSIRLLTGTRANIYHAHDVSALPACAIAAWLRRKPLIFDAHELPTNDTSIRRSWLLSLFASILKFVLPRCAGVITVSPPIAQEIHKTYHPKSVTLVRNIPPYQRVEKNNHLRQALGLGPHVRIALYQGGLQANRGLATLISAAHFLEPDTVIVLMGQNTGGVHEQLAEVISRERVEDQVKLLPPVPYNELLAWTASADAGLIIYDPTYSLNVKMCLPNKFFEYLMAGLPILTSELIAITPLLQKYGIGQAVSSLEPQEVGNAINVFLKDQAVLGEMCTNALHTAKEALCWEQERSHLLDLYHTVVEQREKR